MKNYHIIYMRRSSSVLPKLQNTEFCLDIFFNTQVYILIAILKKAKNIYVVEIYSLFFVCVVWKEHPFWQSGHEM